MASMFAPKMPKGTQEPSRPKTIRMPVEEDPAIMEAAQRTKRAAMARQGRPSTILTEQTRSTTGGGQKLGG